jgi:hypothetical protein
MFSYLYHCLDLYRIWLYKWATLCVSYKKQELFILREHLISLRILCVGSVLLIVLVFCAVLLCVYTFWVTCCDARYHFSLKTMFSSSLPPVVCRREHVLFALFVFVCVWLCPTHIVLFFSSSCVPHVARFSGLSFFDFPFAIT